jgi:hypothetical protein
MDATEIETTFKSAPTVTLQMDVGIYKFDFELTQMIIMDEKIIMKYKE